MINQSVASIEDQFRVCREHAAPEKWKVVGTYHEAAISGASAILQPGIQSRSAASSRSCWRRRWIA